MPDKDQDIILARACLEAIAAFDNARLMPQSEHRRKAKKHAWYKLDRAAKLLREYNPTNLR